jgi:peptidoglycan/LPS O-acetylase OafA/YrhL
VREDLVRDNPVPSLGYQPGLDGIRAVAILLVLGQHDPSRTLIDGFVGVTVFFCLSGYLITTLLVTELSSGTIDVPGFYRRRAARLWPALFTVVAVTVGVLLVHRHNLTAGLKHTGTLSVGQVFAPAAAALTYTTNLFDWAGHPFFSYDYFNYTWTLSVEEQFYLLWPFALLLVYRRSRHLFAAGTLLLIALSATQDLRLGLGPPVKFDQHGYFGTDTNALPILVGALLAIAVMNGWVTRKLTWGLGPFALVAVVLLVKVGHHNDTFHPSLVIVEGTALTLILLAVVVTRPRSLIGWLLETPPMRWLGQRAYSIYLWNVLARIAVLAWLGKTHLGDLAYATMFLIMAEVSFRFIERPLRAKLAHRKPAAAAPSPGPSVPVV